MPLPPDRNRSFPAIILLLAFAGLSTSILLVAYPLLSDQQLLILLAFNGMVFSILLAHFSWGKKA